MATMTRSEKLFIFFSMLAVFLVTAEYGITRPASQAMFITFFSAKVIPWVWLGTIPLNLMVISLYNRFLSRVGPFKILCAIATITIIINGLSGVLCTSFPAWILFQFAWKDIYILFMLKQVWSLIHSTIPSGRAKYLYGFIYGIGTLGSVFGSLIPGFCAVKLGSESLYFFTLPIYLLLIFAYKQAFAHSHYVSSEIKQTAEKGAFSMVWKTPYLMCVLILVVLMQVTVGLMEYQFNAHLELSIIEKDLRTQYVGQMMTYVNLLSGFFQIVGSFIMIQALGVRGSHLTVPLILLMNAAALIYLPSFALISFAFVFIKAVDFSLFGVIREMLYVPMKLDEKYRAKAVIDVFAYRSSKALVSVCILGLQFFSGANLLPWASIAGVGVLFIWLLTVWFLLRKHYPETSTIKDLSAS